MTAQQSELSTELAAPDVDRVTERWVVRRARHLCGRAEPHTDQSPCPAHLTEANRQLLGLPG